MFRNTLNAYLCEQKRMDEKKLQKIGWQMGDNDSDRSVGILMTSLH